MINIGRPGPWGNPFRVGVSYTRESAVEAFHIWLAANKDPRAQWIRNNIHLLHGKTLWCPGCKGTSPCHGDILKEYLNEYLRRK